MSIAVTLAVGSGAGPSKTFVIRAGDVLRVGRGAANDFVLALGGISTCHAELFLRSSEADSASGAGDLYVRDTSKNGTGVSTGTPTKWQALPRGGLVKLQNGWRLLLPLRGRPKEAAELAHTLTVGIAAPDRAVAKDRPASEALLAGTAVKAKTPRRKPREKKVKSKRHLADRAAEEREEAVARRAKRTLERVALQSQAALDLRRREEASKELEPKKHRKRRRHRKAEGEVEAREERGKKEKRRRRRDDEHQRSRQAG